MSSEHINQATSEEVEELANQAVKNALLEQTFTELAALNPIEYDRRRDEAAKTLGIRVSTLDAEVEKRRRKPDPGSNGEGRKILLADIEPWAESVDGAALLDDIRKIFERYVILPAGAAVMLALWILHTYTLDANEQTPYVAITSPEMRCGKSRVLQIMRTLASRTLSAANITAAAVYRTIEAYKPTLLIDEADSFLRENEELRGVLNSGFERNGSVIRNVGDNHEPRQFATWCAKAIAKIGKLTGTLHDRSIEIAMRRKKAEEKVERLRESRLMRTNEELRQCDCAWSDTNGLYYSGNGRGPLAFHSIAPARNSSRYRRRRTHVCERGGPLDDRSSCTGGRGGTRSDKFRSRRATLRRPRDQ